MTRQLVDVLDEYADSQGVEVDGFVASLLADGPAEHTIVCPTCEGKGGVPCYCGDSVFEHTEPCPNCTNGRQTIEVIARVKR